MNGQPRPERCRACGRRLRPAHTTLEQMPGTVPHRGLGLCSTHYVAQWERANRAKKAPQPRDPSAARQALIEDVEWLISCGEAAPQVAARTGKSPVNLERTLYRAGRPDLVRALKVSA